MTTIPTFTSTVLLVRHGETDWNREQRWQGHADVPLNAVGRRQARLLAGELAGDPPAALYSSDLSRARDTAEIVASVLALPVGLDPRLREVDVGEWSGLTMAEVERLYPEGARRRQEGGSGWSGGEQHDAMAARVLAALREIGERHAGERVLVVTHGGPMHAVWRSCAETASRSPRYANCAVEAIAVEGGGIRRLDSW